MLSPLYTCDEVSVRIVDPPSPLLFCNIKSVCNHFSESFYFVGPFDLVYVIVRLGHPKNVTYQM